jgi:adenylylsulfate kinase
MKTVCIDFDGVLAQYDGWKGEEVVGEPVPGAIEFLELILKGGYRPMTWSTRPYFVINNWVRKYCPRLVEEILVPHEGQKPIAFIYIDDRAWLFRGVFPTLLQLATFKAHWEK